mgnify:CR=1 FL=1
MLIIIVILFYVVWIPFFIMAFISSAKLPCVYFWLAAYILPILNPVVNPVVYFVFNVKYRRGFIEILCCLWLFTKMNNNRLNKLPRQGNRVHNASKPNQVLDNVKINEQ